MNAPFKDFDVMTRWAACANAKREDWRFYTVLLKGCTDLGGFLSQKFIEDALREKLERNEKCGEGKRILNPGGDATIITLHAEQIERLAHGEVIVIDGVELVFLPDEHFATGAEIKDFYLNGWDDDYYYEPDNASVQIEDENGKWIAEDSRLYRLADLGTLHWQNAPEPDKPDFLDFEKAFLAWKKNKQYEIVINGKKYKRTSPQSYFDIAGTWGNAPAFVTVMYDHADAPKECGTLDPGESVKVKDGTIFDASAISIR